MLVHWCDRGRSLSGREVFLKGGPDHHADILIHADLDDGIEGIVRTWNALNGETS